MNNSICGHTQTQPHTQQGVKFRSVLMHKFSFSKDTCFGAPNPLQEFCLKWLKEMQMDTHMARQQQIHVSPDGVYRLEDSGHFLY